MTKPVVTLGVCAKDSESFIKDAIVSIIFQDFPYEYMEVIFVDDGSTDRTLPIILDLIPEIDMPTKVFSREWKGLGATRNIVVDNARGEYIVWVDSDMLMPEVYVRKLLNFIEENPDAGIVKGKKALSEAANLVGTLEIYSRAAGKMKGIDHKGRTRSFPLGAGGCIYRTEAIRRAGGFDEKLRGYGEDWDAELRIRSAGWDTYIVDLYCRDYERAGISWKELWRRYVWRGYSQHYFFQKNKGVECLPEMTPPVAFFSGFMHSLTIFRLTHRKLAFLLPLLYVYKMTAWFLGYLEAVLHSKRY